MIWTAKKVIIVLSIWLLAGLPARIGMSAVQTFGSAEIPTGLITRKLRKRNPGFDYFYSHYIATRVIMGITKESDRKISSLSICWRWAKSQNESVKVLERRLRFVFCFVGVLMVFIQIVNRREK